MLVRSERAYEQFAQDWDNSLGEAWPRTWEVGLTVRDDWPDLVLPAEREVLRQDLADCAGLAEYPFGGECAFDGVTAARQRSAPGELLREADLLATLIGRARRLERMLRDHAAGGSCRADEP